MLNPALVRGRKFLLQIILLMLAINILSAVTYNRHLLVRQAVWLAILAALLYMVYRGFEWAKAVAGTIGIAGGLFGLYALINVRILSLDGFIMIVVTCAYFFCGAALFSSEYIARFLKYQRKRKQAGPPADGHEKA